MGDLNFRICDLRSYSVQRYYNYIFTIGFYFYEQRRNSTPIRRVLSEMLLRNKNQLIIYEIITKESSKINFNFLTG